MIDNKSKLEDLLEQVQEELPDLPLNQQIILARGRFYDEVEDSAIKAVQALDSLRGES
tara:strand:- start:830 stop:1003 length:174 start_codon:yes stop_codon:yes gene_type:complete